jgi:hypothetical protein
MFSDIYENFLIVWNNPSSTVTFSSSSNTTNSIGRTYSLYGTHKTLNGNQYSIRKSSDNLFWIYKDKRPYFKSHSMVIDYIEYQNRVIYTTPNGRKYGIYNIQ